MDKELKKIFMKNVNKLKENNIECKDFSEICFDLRLYRDKLTKEEKEQLLEVVDFVFQKCYFSTKTEQSLFDRLLSVVNKDKKIDELEWAQINRDYFKGNLNGKDEFAIKYRRILSRSYRLNDLKDYIKDILKNENFYNNDFYLRNVEVILRDVAAFNKKYSYYGETLAAKIQSICS